MVSFELVLFFELLFFLTCILFFMSLCIAPVAAINFLGSGLDAGTGWLDYLLRTSLANLGHNKYLLDEEMIAGCITQAKGVNASDPLFTDIALLDCSPPTISKNKNIFTAVRSSTEQH